MKALICRRFGDPTVLSLESCASPPLPGGHIRIAVEYAGIGFQDLLMIAGAYQLRPDTPFIPGNEVSGTIIECAADVTTRRVGQRVIAILSEGGYSEEAIAPEAASVVLPESVSFATGAAIGIPYGTAYQALIERAGTKRGDVVFVRGAGGGVGLAAIQVARHFGATVIASASSAEKRAASKKAGAEFTIDTSRENTRERVLEITSGNGADIIFDPVGTNFKDDCLRCIAREGRILVVGFAGGKIPQIPAHYVLNKYCSVIGVNWGRSYFEADPEKFYYILNKIIQMCEGGALDPTIGIVVTPNDAAKVLKQIMERQISGRALIAFGKAKKLDSIMRSTKGR